MRIDLSTRRKNQMCRKQAATNKHTRETPSLAIPSVQRCRTETMARLPFARHFIVPPCLRVKLSVWRAGLPSPPSSDCVGIWARPSLSDINNSVTRGWASVPPHYPLVLKLCPTWSGGVWAAELLAPPCCGGVPISLGPNACHKRFRS